MKWLSWKSIFNIAMVFAVTGCATSGLGGTTTLTTKYDSNVLADGAEHTIYEQTAKGKAGDVLQAVSQATLNTEDGTGSKRSMAVGATQNNDATRRADSIDAVNQMWSQAFVSFTEQLTAALTQIAGIAGQVKQAEAAAGVEKTKARTGAIVEVSKNVKLPAPVETPLTDVPVTP